MINNSIAQSWKLYIWYWKLYVKTVIKSLNGCKSLKELLWHHISTHQNLPTMTYNHIILVTWISGKTQLIPSWCIKNNPPFAKRMEKQIFLAWHLIWFNDASLFLSCCTVLCPNVFSIFQQWISVDVLKVKNTKI